MVPVDQQEMENNNIEDRNSSLNKVNYNVKFTLQKSGTPTTMHYQNDDSKLATPRESPDMHQGDVSPVSIIGPVKNKMLTK